MSVAVEQAPACQLVWRRDLLEKNREGLVTQTYGWVSCQLLPGQMIII